MVRKRFASESPSSRHGIPKSNGWHVPSASRQWMPRVPKLGFCRQDQILQVSVSPYVTKMKLFDSESTDKWMQYDIVMI